MLAFIRASRRPGRWGSLITNADVMLGKVVVVLSPRTSYVPFSSSSLICISSPPLALRRLSCNIPNATRVCVLLSSRGLSSLRSDQEEGGSKAATIDPNIIISTNSASASASTSTSADESRISSALYHPTATTDPPHTEASLRPIDMSRNDFLQALGLKSFSEDEMHLSYASLLRLGASSSQSHLAIGGGEGGSRGDGAEVDARDADASTTTAASVTTIEPNDSVKRPEEAGVDVRVLRRAVRDRYLKEMHLSSSEYRIVNMDELIAMSGLDQGGKRVNYDQYKAKMSAFAERIDSKVWTIAAAFFLTGSSLGVVLPCMPLLVNQLGISSSEFGLVVSSLSLAKLLSNIPASHFVETIGRKPLIISGLGFCALGIGGIGASLFPGLGLPWLIGCRVVTGVGVSAFVAGSFMYLIDLSTNLNRARTNAPATAGFNAGLAVGPAMGGVLLEQVGISYAYFTVGGLFAALTVLTQIIIKETKAAHISPIDKEQQPQLKDAFSVTFKKWRELFKLRDVRNMVMLNTFFWGCLGGIQMTMLPMLMLQPQLNLEVSQISASFAIISITSFLLAQPIAYVSDRFDKIGVSCAGAMMIVGASLLIPHSTSFMELAAALVPLSVGSTVLQATPASHMANIVPQGDKAQALSLLRTGGDIGMLCGASAAGAVAALTSVQSMIMLDGGVLAACTAAVAASHYLTGRGLPGNKKKH